MGALGRHARVAVGLGLLLLAGSTPVAAQAVTADVGITKTADRHKAKVGELITYTITVTNYGPATATDVVFGDSLPDDLNIVSLQCGQDPILPVGYNYCTVAELPVGASYTATLVATPAYNAKKRQELTTNTSIISSAATADPNPANNQASVTVGVNGRPSW